MAEPGDRREVSVQSFDLQFPGDLPIPGVFSPNAQYSHVGDLLQVYLEDEPAYAEQLTPEITVLRAFSDNRIVGVKVSGIVHRVNK